ncbi:MAG TPA: hypothetical protein VLX92_05385 [Kofleriaceae bacterium]|nr:hypothetical protein [Kofleriaceae bacterium]
MRTSELASPTRIAVIGIVGMAGLGVGLGLHASQPPAQTAPVADLPAPPPPPAPERAVAQQAATPSDQLLFVFDVRGRAYVQLAALDRVPHVHPRLVHEDTDEVAIAALPAWIRSDEQRAWLGTKVEVDSECIATIDQLDVIARVTGDAGYADEHSDEWTADAVVAHGKVMLAARLDHCDGRYARPLALGHVIAFDDAHDDALAGQARAQLFGSAAARAIDARWNFAQDGNWRKDVPVDTLIERDPVTGDTYASVHVHTGFGCGGPDVNLWGLYRRDADGHVAQLELRELDEQEVISIDRLLDVGNDGRVEVLAKTDLGLDTVLMRSGGEVLGELELPYFGCPC